MRANGLEAVVFDYGSTLVEFSKVQLAKMDDAMGDALESAYGRVDRTELVRRRNVDRVAPYTEPYRENDVRGITVSLVEALYGESPTEELVDQLLSVRRQQLLDSVAAPDFLGALLARIGQSYRVGLLSNYPCAETIRSSVREIGIEEAFDAIVVSADVGHVKPHPLPFTTVAAQLDVAPEQCVMVGDNWLGDIQGAKRVGMQAVHCTQWDTPETFEPQPGDHPADATVAHLEELLPMLGV